MPTISYTAFTSTKSGAITARLIVRRVRDLNRQAAAGQGELFGVWRYHAVFTDSPIPGADSASTRTSITPSNRVSHP